jgi:hypothetical protein
MIKVQGDYYEIELIDTQEYVQFNSHYNRMNTLFFCLSQT